MLLIDENVKLRLSHVYAMRGSSYLSMIVSQFYSKFIPLVGTVFHDRTSESLQSLFFLKIYKTTLSISNRSLRKLHNQQTVSLLLMELSADDSSFSWESFCWISAVSLAISGCCSACLSSHCNCSFSLFRSLICLSCLAFYKTNRRLNSST